MVVRTKDVIFIGKININNMRFHTYNGVLPEERKLGQPLEIDCQLSYPIESRVKHDTLDETVNYAAVYETVKEFVTDHSFNLIESVANQLKETILNKYPAVTAVKLRVRKYAVPIDGTFDNVEVEVAGGRDE